VVRDGTLRYAARRDTRSYYSARRSVPCVMPQKRVPNRVADVRPEKHDYLLIGATLIFLIIFTLYLNMLKVCVSVPAWALMLRWWHLGYCPGMGQYQ